MKNLKRVLTLALAVLMILGFFTDVFAGNSDGSSKITGKITIDNPQKDEVYSATKIFDATYLDSDPSQCAYFLTADSPWEKIIIRYATPADTLLERGWKTTTANGLTLERIVDLHGTTTGYNVKTSSEFRVADFIEVVKPVADSVIAGMNFDERKLYYVEFDGAEAEGLDLGYWLVLPSLGALVTLTTTTPSVSVKDKNEEITVEKYIVGEGMELDCKDETHVRTEDHTIDCYKRVDTKLKSSVANVGDVIPYIVETKVPDMTGYVKYFFVLSDTMSKGLTYNEDVIIRVSDKLLVEGVDYTVQLYTRIVDCDDKSEGHIHSDACYKLVKKEEVREDDEIAGSQVRVIFNDMLQYADKVLEPIIARYSATINERADTNNGINTNDVNLYFSTDPSFDPDTERLPGEGNEYDPFDPIYKWNHPELYPDSKSPIGGLSDTTQTKTYVAEIRLKKVDRETGATLTGAKFSLSGESQNIVIVNNTIFTEDPDGEYYRLRDGTYTTTAPTGSISTYEYNEFNGDRFAWIEHEKGLNVYFVRNGEYIQVTEDNYEDAEGPFYLLEFRTLGLFYKKGEEYVQITTVEDAAMHLNDTLYSQTIHTHNGNDDEYDDTTTRYKMVEEINKETRLVHVESEGWVDENGLLSFGGLGAGTYKITEQVAPDGYKMLTGPIEIVIAMADDESGLIATANGEPITLDLDGILTFDVDNVKSSKLPGVGGIGITLFYVFGGILLICAAIVFLARKRLSAKA